MSIDTWGIKSASFYVDDLKLNRTPILDVTPTSAIIGSASNNGMMHGEVINPGQPVSVFFGNMKDPWYLIVYTEGTVTINGTPTPIDRDGVIHKNHANYNIPIKLWAKSFGPDRFLSSVYTNGFPPITSPYFWRGYDFNSDGDTFDFFNKGSSLGPFVEGSLSGQYNFDLDGDGLRAGEDFWNSPIAKTEFTGIVSDLDKLWTELNTPINGGDGYVKDGYVTASIVDAKTRDELRIGAYGDYTDEQKDQILAILRWHYNHNAYDILAESPAWLFIPYRDNKIAHPYNGFVVKEDFVRILSTEGQRNLLWNDLLAQAYIDNDGVVQDKFNALTSYSAMNLAYNYDGKEIKIYKVLQHPNNKAIVMYDSDVNSWRSLSSSLMGAGDHNLDLYFAAFIGLEQVKYSLTPNKEAYGEFIGKIIIELVNN